MIWYNRWTHILIIQFVILALIIPIATLKAGVSTTSDEEIHKHHPLHCGKAHAVIQRIKAGKLVSEQKVEYEGMVNAGLREALEDTDLLHCDLEIEITSFSAQTLAGTCILSIESRTTGLSQFTFRLREQYDITSATIGVTPVAVSKITSTTRVATLDRPYDIGESFELKIVYNGAAVSVGIGSIEFTSHSSTNIVYTLSQPYYAYSFWPTKDGDWGDPGDMGDKFTLDCSIIAPDTMVSASNGILAGIDSLSGNRSRYRWSGNYPISTYLCNKARYLFFESVNQKRKNPVFSGFLCFNQNLVIPRFKHCEYFVFFEFGVIIYGGKFQ